jgi:alkylated DNA repair dioxygenase AlkB
MEDLFPTETVLPAGFSYQSDFISAEEEKTLMECIAHIELHTFRFQGYEAKRKVASFGYNYSFEKRAISPGKNIPREFDALVEKVSHHVEVDKDDFAELLITEYPPLSVINWHRDAPPFGIIAGISLLSDCTFRLRPHEKSRRTCKAVISFPVKCRSLYLMQGSARNDWQHSISPVPSRRYSITLRTLRKL